MTHLEEELEQLMEAVVSMTKMTISQMQKAKEAYLTMDVDIAEEVVHNEARINAMELSIDRDCENIFALFNPVASDLRLVMAVLKIIADLERIGDYAHGIANYVIEENDRISEDLLDKTQVFKMFDVVISMLEDIKIAIVEEDTKLARKVYQKDSKLNKINKNASEIITEFIKSDPEITRKALYLFSVIRKLERAGDHIKNIAEDLIFYVEVVVLRHKRAPEN